MTVTAVEASTYSFISSLFSLAPSGQKKKKKKIEVVYKKDHPMASDPSFLMLSNTFYVILRRKEVCAE